MLYFVQHRQQYVDSMLINKICAFIRDYHVGVVGVEIRIKLCAGARGLQIDGVHHWLQISSSCI